MDSLLQQAVASAGLHSKLINGKDYSLQLLPASEGIAIATELFTLFGPTVANAFDSLNNEEFLLPEDSNPFTQAALLLVKGLNKEEVVRLIRTICREISCNGHKIDFEKHFAGNYGELLLVVEWSLRENFSDVFTLWLKEKGLEIPSLSSLKRAAPKVEIREPSQD